MSYSNSIRQLAHAFHEKVYQNTDEHAGVYEKPFANENQSEAKNRNNQSQVLHEQVMVTVGEEHGGGIVFYVDGTGKHGLIVAKADMPTLSSDKEEGGFTWCDAKAACTTFESNGYRDWFLPNKEQLNQLYLNKLAVGGFVDNHYYWSSTEYNEDIAWLQNFTNGTHYVISKTYGLDRVRAVRAF
jgi:hypothetical protein